MPWNEPPPVLAGAAMVAAASVLPLPGLAPRATPGALTVLRYHAEPEGFEPERYDLDLQVEFAAGS